MGGYANDPSRERASMVPEAANTAHLHRGCSPDIWRQRLGLVRPIWTRLQPSPNFRHNQPLNSHQSLHLIVIRCLAEAGNSPNARTIIDAHPHTAGQRSKYTAALPRAISVAQMTIERDGSRMPMSTNVLPAS